MKRALAASPFLLVLGLTAAALLRLQPAPIAINGGPEFTARTREALRLLRLSAGFPEVRRFVAEIREARCSGMNVYAPHPTYDVGEPTWKAGALWYAGTIAHDAHHSRLYFEAKGSGKAEPEEAAWSGAEAEKKCLAVQYRVLAELRAPEVTLAYIRGLSVAPTYQNIGAGKADPCDDRKW